MFHTLSVIQFALLVGAVFLSGLILASANAIGETLDIMDHPDGLRKVHAKATPLVAGLATLVPLFFWCAASVLLKSSLDTRTLLVILLCGSGATLVGYSDDQSSTSPSSRLLSIFLFAVIALVLDHRLVPISIGFGGIGALAIPAWAAFFLAAVALAGLVNAVNMADGQNGIVIGMTVVWCVCIALTTSGTPAIVAQMLATTSVIAFVFNLAGFGFLGDSGTYGVGFVVGLLAIWAHNGGNVPAQTLCVWFLLPVLDCLRLLVKRLSRKRYPFGADRDHLHHRLQARLGNTLSLVVYLGVVATTSIAAALDFKIAPLCLISLTAFYFAITLSRDASNVTEFHTEQTEQRLRLTDEGVMNLAEHRKRVGEQR